MKFTLAVTLSIAPLIAAAFASEPDYSSSLFRPFHHKHLSSQGTPYVHSFGIEPAFTGRDLFFDHSYRNNDSSVEQELELEMEWAFTHRLGIIAEIPYVFENADDSPSKSGFGDLAIVPRVLLIEHDRFLLTAQTEFGLPTGSENFGNETSIAPGIATWIDLGNWFTLNSQIAIEHGFDSDASELSFGFGLIKSFDLHSPHTCSEGHAHNSNSTLLNLHLELNGSTPINGDDRGDFVTEGLFGVSYGITNDLGIRMGYQFPISTPHDFDHGITTGIIYHF